MLGLRRGWRGFGGLRSGPSPFRRSDGARDVAGGRFGTKRFLDPDACGDGEYGQVMILSPEQFDKQLKRELADMEKLTSSLGFVKE